MGMNRTVDRQPVSVAEAHLVRVAETGCSRHPHLTALLDSSGPNAWASRPKWVSPHHSTASWVASPLMLAAIPVLNLP